MEDSFPLTYGFSQLDSPMEYQGGNDSGIPLFWLTQELHQWDAEENREIVQNDSLKPPPSESTEMTTKEGLGSNKDPNTDMKSMLASIFDGSNTKTTGTNIFHNCVFNFK